jgi:hypothetical protein
MKINYLGHRWTVNFGKSSLGDKFALLTRPVSISEIKRNGSCVTAFDCPIYLISQKKKTITTNNYQDINI